MKSYAAIAEAMESDDVFIDDPQWDKSEEDVDMAKAGEYKPHYSVEDNSLDTEEHME